MNTEKKKLFLICGIPGSGKSTWCKNQLNSFPNSILISRDDIRRSYKLHDSEIVSKYLYDKIQTALDNKNIETIFVDTLHRNKFSRATTLDNLKLNNVDIYIINFQIPIETCLAQNKLRPYTTRIPECVIHSIYKDYEIPTYNEKYHYTKIVNINLNNRNKKLEI